MWSTTHITPFEGNAMIYSDFQASAIRWKNFLAPKNQSLKHLLTTKHDRMNTTAIYYALTDKQLFQEVIELAKEDRNTKQILVNLYHTLTSENLPGYVKPVALHIKNLFFRSPDTDFIVHHPPTSPSKYMEKYLINLVDEFNLENQIGNN
ncbi:hypothetical protein [Paenibacillus piri]|uniref:Uncharacterized protein n=1 Tax=Paenibacillus piri TaxID=2547395 RepID=A0A4R5KI88_9BACL|nr:hypothetical protein [Paenibacillus piri]TDF95181.1 hypothetical protein E1757_21900 [Paenibacillus piri]